MVRQVSTVLVGGVAVFWAVAWVVTEGGRRGLYPNLLSPEVAVGLSVSSMLVGLAVTFVLRRRMIRGSALFNRLSPVNRLSPGGSRDSGSASSVTGLLLLRAVLLELPALVAGGLFLLSGAGVILAAVAPLYAVGVGLAFPRQNCLFR